MAELKFIVLKINGIDVRHLPQQEAVQMFLGAANEPLFVEMQRENSTISSIYHCDDGDDDSSSAPNVINKNNCAVRTNHTGSQSSPSVSDIKLKLCDLKLPNNFGNHGDSTSIKLTKPSNYNLQNEIILTLSGATVAKGRPSLPTLTTATTTITPTTATTTIASSKTTTTAATMNTTAEMLPTTKATQTNDIFYELNEHSVKEATNRLIEEEHVRFEQCLAPEIDIEEITLTKRNSDESIGLTVCYGNNSCSSNNMNSKDGGGYFNANNECGAINGALSGTDDNEMCAEVYINNIKQESIAGRDGRLHQGDLILQINGKDIKTKDQAETLIKEIESNQNVITFLVSRYMYTDEDDFIDPSVEELDVEDFDDDEEEEYYDDNNLAYENCFITTNDYINVANELDKVFIKQTNQQLHNTTEQQQNKRIFLPHDNIENTVSGIINDNPPNDTELAAMPSDTSKKATTSIPYIDNLEISFKKLSKENAKESHIQLQLQQCANTVTEKSKTLFKATTISQVVAADYDTEHIYETIPEDLETEPFYCSPYDSSTYLARTCNDTAVNINNCSGSAQQLQQQKQRVAQWLGIKPVHLSSNASTIATAPKQSARSSSGCGRSCDAISSTCFISSSKSNRNDTVRSAITTITSGSSSSGGGGNTGLIGSTPLDGCTINIDEHDNSSSAYNTGGSNNSVAPCMLVVNENFTDSLTYGLESEQSTGNPSMYNGNKSTQQQQHLQPPKNFQIGADAIVVVENSCLHSPKATHKGNMPQQHQQHQRQDQLLPASECHCSQFTAPNLSQYHFVSSQEVCPAMHINANQVPPTTTAVVVTTHKALNDETTPAMVWKVKRRPDGTRYIVRRPARNTATRLMRESRALHLNSDHLRNELTTSTEEGTISEIKTGRYWSREERKKHIERARERQQQHLQYTELPMWGNPNVSTMRINGKTMKVHQRDRLLRQNSSAKGEPHHQQSFQQYLTQSFTLNNKHLCSGGNIGSINSSNTPLITKDLLTSKPSLILPSKSVASNMQNICNSAVGGGDSLVITTSIPVTTATSVRNNTNINT